MLAKDKFILAASLKNSGLSYRELAALIDYVSCRTKDSKQILSNSDKLIEVIKYFKEKEYPLSLIAKISVVCVNNISAEKAKKVDKTILSCGYSAIETQKIEAVNTHNIFTNNVEKTGIKLSFYNDIGVKDKIVETSFRLRQPFELSFARHRYLLDKNCSLEQEKLVLFLSESAFWDAFKVWNDDLLSRYPMDNPKYLKKIKFNDFY